ncbi:F-box/FBD/LRR-repeat protein At4g26340-like [Corylus avellana]|uniref:F-box/FBD/LRR-repeat protein At4g26340-like n=1 Tax=Corylus avellana TaxID=13451 RepID=UPI00286B9880|nr:F-box/FBD/LRR-repeat protein At4g26340-like [Corylus avellana]XP_059433952.1 F-box/FBD/LRR-repeat protein At4g26340-like [Corylus avellana]
MEHKIDRISELPDPILEHLLSFIPTKQTLQLSILSKRWQRVWALFPIPDFDQDLFVNNLRKVPPNEKEQEIQRKKEEFRNFVERSLLAHYRQRLNINKFMLHMMLDESDYAVVNRWIDYAIECNVKELNLDIFIRIHLKRYELPERVLVANSITELKLRSCKLKSFSGDINLSSLKKLDLSVEVEESQLVQTLIDSCRDIEEMTFECVNGLKSIRVSGLPKLKAIALLQNSNYESVEIEASNLESLVFNLDSLPCQINLGPCENLKKLVLYSCHITDKWLHDVLSKHQLLECLDLANCFMLKRIKISSHRMKSLTFINCRKLVEVDIVSPNLHRLKYEGKVISFSLNSSSLSEVILFFKGDTPDAEMIEFLSKLSQPKLLTWTLGEDETLKIAKRLRTTIPCPLYNVKELKLIVYSIPTREIHEVVDVLLWICPLLEILFIERRYQGTLDNISFKFSYGNPIYKVKNRSCCKRLSVLCWRHCLKTVKIANSKGSAEEETLKKYFFKNAKILESFHYL